MLPASACSFFAIVSGLSMRTSTVPAATSWPRTTGISATRPSTRAAMSNRVASTSPCTIRGCGRTRYQIDKAATKAITRPTMIDESQVDEGGRCLVTSLDGGSGVLCLCTSGFGISIAHSPQLNAACWYQQI
jgi:hypothetical protein